MRSWAACATLLGSPAAWAQGAPATQLEIFPASETAFFARAVEAEVRFDGADSSHLVLHQNGQQIRAPKL